MKWHLLEELTESGAYLYSEGGFHVPQCMLILVVNSKPMTLNRQSLSTQGVYLGPLPPIPEEPKFKFVNEWFKQD